MHYVQSEKNCADLSSRLSLSVLYSKILNSKYDHISYLRHDAEADLSLDFKKIKRETEIDMILIKTLFYVNHAHVLICFLTFLW